MADLLIDVRSNLKETVVRFEAATTKMVADATVRALNRTATSVRAEASRRIRERYNLRAAVVRKQLRITNARRSRLISEVTASGRRIPLIEFSPSPSKPGRTRRPGVSVRVTKQRKLIPHTFIARMPSGHVGVFERKGKSRLPIRELFSLSLPQAFSQREILAAMKKLAALRFNAEFARELKFRTGAMTNG